MRTIGRILLVIAGVIMLCTAIPTLIDSIKLINSSTSWFSQEMFENEVARNAFITIISNGLICFIAAEALLCALLAKGGKLLLICSVIVIWDCVWATVTGIQNNSLTKVENVFKLIGKFGTPICYFAGTILLMIRGK